MFGNDPTPELRECKKCFRIVPKDEMYKRQGYITAKVCANCIEIVGRKAAIEAAETEALKFEPAVVTFEDLPVGKKIIKK